MPQTLSQIMPSAATTGLGILIAATATAGTLLHTTGISDTDIDNISIQIVNTSASEVKATIEFGGVTSPDCLIELTIPPESGPVAIATGLPLCGTGVAGRSVRAFAATTNVLVAYVQVMRVQVTA